MRRLVPLCAAIAAGALALTAGPAGAGTSFTVNEKQWSLSKPPALKHGVTYTVKVHNAGTFPHDLLIDGKGLDDRGIHNAHPIAAGATQTFTVKFPKAGTYHFYCAIKGHAAKGMTEEVRVS
jgi:uncharacterized cupredoxin-like copper-binding protein